MGEKGIRLARPIDSEMIQIVSGHYVPKRELELLGKQVKVTIDYGGFPDPNLPAIIVTGQLLSFEDSGCFTVLCDDGFVHYGWPMLKIEEIEE